MFREPWLPDGFEFLCGLPEPDRQRQLMLTLEAWFDDSGSKGHGRWLTISGLLGRAALLADVASDWRRALAESTPRRIRHFKLSEAVGLRRQFNKWTSAERDDKVLALAAVLDRTDLVQISASIDIAALATIEPDWSFIGGKHPLRAPYIMALFYVVTAAIQEARLIGQKRVDGALEIIFDNQDVFRQTVLEHWDAVKIVLGQDDQRFIPPSPTFRDDMRFVLLQAADLLAGEARRRLDGNGLPVHWPNPLCPQLRVSDYSRVFDEQELQDTDTHLKWTVINKYLGSASIDDDDDLLVH